MASTGAVFEGRCLASSADALDAYYSKAAPVLALDGSMFSEFVKDSGVWYLKSYSVDSFGVYTLRFSTLAQVPTFAACDPAESFIDGMTVGWGVVAAMVAVWSIKSLQKAL